MKKMNEVQKLILSLITKQQNEPAPSARPKYVRSGRPTLRATTKKRA